MIDYLIKKSPKISLILILILFVTNLLTLLIVPFGNFVMLYPSNLNEPLNWYRLLTYPCYVGGLLTWLINSLVVFLTGYIIENRIKRLYIIILIALSSFIGGLVFILINKDDPNNIPIASPTMISWGYWTAAIVLGIKFWKTLNLFERIILFLCILSVLSIGNQNIGFLLGQIAVITTSCIWTLIILKKNSA
jgi:membrane associated rhomboid family serine protease